MYFKSMGKKSSTALAISAFLLLASCGNNATKDATVDSSNRNNIDSVQRASDLQPAQPKPAWGKDLTDPMAVVIEKLASYNAPPLVTLSAQEARKQPSPADAAMAVMLEHNLPVPPNNVDTTGKEIPVQGGQIHARIYTPNTGKTAYPVIVYYHGGGWVIANLDTYNASAQGLANQVEAVVVSVAYRQAPEHKFPTAHNDCYAAYEWAVKNAASIKGDPKKVAVVGESAGGNLACAVSMMARDKGFQLPVYQVLVYPIAGYDFNTPSYQENDSTKPLSSGLMKWFFDKYLNSPAEGKNPMISLVTANLKGLPRTTIVSAQYDPLRSEGETLADNLQKAGVEVKRKLYDGTTHEFFGMAAVLPEAKDAQAMVSSDLKSAFNK
ncbi:MAG: alpha/beta hydrolase [Ginsengibacter sp.]|jgi:acetyl esterase/lipase